MSSTTVGTVQQLWRYPAKSMLGGQIESARILDIGLEGDRRWAVRDGTRGGIRGAKKIAGLMECAARYVDGVSGDIEVRMGDGAGGEVVIRSDAAEVDDVLSAHLGHPVSLEACASADDLDHFRRGAPDTDDLDAELRSIFGREPHEPLPDLSLFPPVIVEYESPPGTYVDAHPVHLLTTTSLESVSRLAPESDVDVRRFRPTLVVETPDATAVWPEQEWVGRSLELGSVVLDIVGPCPRCVMVTRGFDTVEPDRRILRGIVAEADQNLGVYATVRRTGDVAVGDEAALFAP